MMLALAIVFLWAGSACLFVAFHPPAADSLTGRPGDVLSSLQAKLTSSDSAYAQKGGAS